MTTRRPTVLIADDHALFAEGLVGLLSEHAEVVGVAGDGAHLVTLAVAQRPDIILVDLSMPSCGGLEALRRLKARGVASKILILTMHADPRLASEALKAGASGFLLKNATGDELVAAIGTILRGNTYLTPELTGDVLTLMAQPTPIADVQLSTRQRQVLELVVEGRRMKEIAGALELSPRTVETVKYEMMQSLGVHSTAELVKYAIQHRLVSIDLSPPAEGR